MAFSVCANNLNLSVESSSGDAWGVPISILVALRAFLFMEVVKWKRD